MNLVRCLLLPALLDAAPSEFDLAAKKLDALIVQRGGVGLVVSVELQKNDLISIITHQNMSSGAKWAVRFSHFNPETQKDEEFSFTKHEKDELNHLKYLSTQTSFRKRKNVRTFKVQLISEAFGSITEEINLPETDQNPQVYTFHRSNDKGRSQPSP